MVNYADLVNKNGTIYNTQTGQGYPTPQALAADLGIAAGSIQWGQIQNRPDYVPGLSFGGSSPAPAPAPTPTPTAAPQTGTTGDPTLDGILGALQGHIDTQLANGQKINPNIEITPSTVQQFLDQATNEIDPYYKNQYNVIKSDLSRNLDVLSKSYDINKRQNENQFKQDLNNKREQLAGNGLAYSGFRGQQEKQLATDANLNNESAALKAGSAASDAISAAEKTIGSDNLPGNYPSLSEYGASTAGSGSFNPTRTLNFGPIGGITGSDQYSQRGDIRSLQDFLTNQEVTKRTLNFAG